MNATKAFLKSTLVGGVAVLLPLAILVALFAWVVDLLTRLLEPLSDMVIARWEQVGEWAAVVLVLLVIVGFCFVTGLAVRTTVGQWVFGLFERRLFKMAPGYNLIKEVVGQFFGDRPSPFSSVALVRAFGKEALSTAFVTERHDNGWFSVFVPTGPNPTNGQIFHVPPENVYLVDQKVEDVMRSILSCGSGSAPLIQELEQTGKLPKERERSAE